MPIAKMVGSPDDAGFEDTAVRLLRHLEWQDGFSLVFLFADEGGAERLRLWLNQRLDFAGRPLQRVEPAEFPGEAPDFVTRLLRLGQDLPPELPVWVEAYTHPGDAGWDAARRLFLARINERRFLLERDFLRPLILLLPRSFRAEAAAIAPDIWHIRAFSDTLAAPFASSFASPMHEPTAPLAPSPMPPDAAALSAEAEWARLRSHQAGKVNLAVGWRATRLMEQAGALYEASQTAQEVLALARSRCLAAPEEAQALRDLLISLDDVGRIARARGAWDEAEQAYRESLAVSRQLLARLGDTPEALRDLSVSLNNVGGIARARGMWDEAEQAYRESLALSRQLLSRLGDTPEALRDLSVSLNNVGGVARARGAWDEAEQAYRESLAVRRQLLARLGDTPEALRDLSVSLDNVGGVAQARGAWDEAEQAYRESLAVCRQLLARLGDTPEALRDLSVSLNNVGGIARARGAWDEAEQAYRESLALARRVLSASPNRQGAREDVAVPLSLLGLVRLRQGDAEVLRQAIDMYAELTRDFPEETSYRQRREALESALAAGAEAEPGKADPDQGKPPPRPAH